MGKRLTEKQLFALKNTTLATRFGPAVTPLEFYRDLFPEGSLEQPGSYSDAKPNLIATSGYRKSDVVLARLALKEEQEMAAYEAQCLTGDRPPRPKRYKRRWAEHTIIFDDLSGLDAVLKNDNELLEFVIIPPVAFSGKNRTLKNAYHMWGIAIDLDGVEMDQLEDLIHQIDNDVIPEPTYVVNSGHGMHLYYMFEDPIPMYPRLHDQLKELKKALTDVVWNAYTSTISVEKRQYQSIVQGYRAVGSPSKLGKRYRVTAFKVGAKRTLRYLMDWAETERGIDFDEFKHVTLDEARELWPDWYQYRIVEGRSRKTFKFKHRGVYQSWLRRMEQGAFDGNRYNCIAVLFAVAYKTEGMEFDEVMDDALELVPRLNRLTKNKKNEFTIDDVLDASAYFDESSDLLSLKKVYHLTKIYIEPTKRNGRKQTEHLGRARALQNYEDPSGSWRNKDGRPKGSGTAEQKVKDYRAAHPDARKADCIRDTGLSKKTVYKWWDSV